MITARRDRGAAGREALAEALADERRRMAADVHDLIMQDLSFALATARTLAADPSCAPQASVVVAAGERALAGARDVIGGLVGHDREPVVEAVEAVVLTAARGVPLGFDAAGVATAEQPDELTLQTPGSRRPRGGHQRRQARRPAVHRGAPRPRGRVAAASARRRSRVRPGRGRRRRWFRPREHAPARPDTRRVAAHRERVR